MSWLLVAVIPGLLMLAAVGLERLETGLGDDTVTAADVAEFLEQAEATDVTTLVRDGMGEALQVLHRRRAEQIDSYLEWVEPVAEREAPTPRHAHSRANPQFHQTKQPDRV